MAEDFGETDDLAVIDRRLEVAGLSLVDVGCGDGDFARALAERGAAVLAIEPDPIQAEKNRGAAPTAGVTFAEAPAQRIPLEDASADGVLFKYSLHHVPAAEMDAALEDAMRVLKPGSGFLYVMEPVMAGSYAEVMRPFHDETGVRRLALGALERCAAPRFAEAREYRYFERYHYGDFDAFLADWLDLTYDDHRREKIDTPEVRALFEAERSGDGYILEQPIRANDFRRLKESG